MTKFRKKPIEIEAFRFLIDPIPDWFMARVSDNTVTLTGCYRDSKEGIAQIKTLEGTMTAVYGEWIIKGVKGEIYPCKPDIFAATYDEAAATPKGDGQS